MKNNIVLILLLLLLLPAIYAQESNTPILFDIDTAEVQCDPSVKRKKLIVIDENIKDSLKVFFKVKVIFKYPLKDTSHCIIVDSVELMKMKVISLNDNKILIGFDYNEKHGTDYQRSLWNIFSKRIKEWYLNQPYNKMIDREIWDRIVAFGGVVYFMPK